MFSPNTSVLASLYYSSTAPYSSSSTRWSYLKDKRKKPWTVEKQCYFGNWGAFYMQVCSLFSPPRDNVCYVVTYLKYGVLETTFLGLKSTRHATDCSLLLRFKICTLTHRGPHISPYRRVRKDSEECIIASYLVHWSQMSKIFDIILFSFEFHSQKFQCSS